MKKKGYIILSVLVFTILFSSMNLASMLGISSVAATRIINIVNAFSTIATIISIIGVVFGAGVVSTAIVATAKALIKRYGKKYAAAW